MAVVRERSTLGATFLMIRAVGHVPSADYATAELNLKNQQKVAVSSLIIKKTNQGLSGALSRVGHERSAIREGRAEVNSCRHGFMVDKEKREDLIGRV